MIYTLQVPRFQTLSYNIILDLKKPLISPLYPEQPSNTVLPLLLTKVLRRSLRGFGTLDHVACYRCGHPRSLRLAFSTPFDSSPRAPHALHGLVFPGAEKRIAQDKIEISPTKYTWGTRCKHNCCLSSGKNNSNIPRQGVDAGRCRRLLKDVDPVRRVVFRRASDGAAGTAVGGNRRESGDRLAIPP